MSSNKPKLDSPTRARIVRELTRLQSRFVAAERLMERPGYTDDMVSNATDYTPDQLHRAVDEVLQRDHLYDTENLAGIVESACQNIAVRDRMYQQGSLVPTKQAQRMDEKIRQRLARTWGNKRYVVIEPGYPAEDIAALLDAQPHRLRQHPTIAGAWVYKRWTQQEILHEQCRNGVGPSVLQKLMRTTDESAWQQRIDEWARGCEERWAVPLDLDNNRDEFRWRGDK